MSAAAKQWRVRECVVCADGTSLSVQASETHYSVPRDNAGPYVRVEVGYVRGPNKQPIDLPRSWAPFADGSPKQRNNVYGYVPVELVLSFVKRHGGATNPDQLPEAA